MNKIKLLGVRELLTDDNIDANKDYGILLVASRISKEIPDTFEEGESVDDITYKLKVEKIDSIYDLKDKKPIDFQHGRTSSQKYRWLIEQNLGKEEYDNFISYQMSKIDEDCDEYRDNIKKL
jgi:hypothetical protein